MQLTATLQHFLLKMVELSLESATGFLTLFLLPDAHPAILVFIFRLHLYYMLLSADLRVNLLSSLVHQIGYIF